MATAHRDRRQRRPVRRPLRRRGVRDRGRRRSCSSDHENRAASSAASARPARTCARPARRSRATAGRRSTTSTSTSNVEVDRGVDRRARERFLGRVIADSRRIDGILATTMNHDEAYAMWRLGRAIERADMTTRVARACERPRVLVEQPSSAGAEPRRYDELQWMGVLRSLSGLQMYSAGGPRADRGTGGRAVPARARPLPPGRPGAAARDPPGPQRAARPRRAARRGRQRRCRAARLDRRRRSTAPSSTTRWTPCRSRSANSTALIHDRYLRLGRDPAPAARSRSELLRCR